MNKLRSLCIACGAALLSYAAICLVVAQTDTPVEPPAATAPFPIVTRVTLPHNYGYFLGDAIPLTLLVETTQDIVLDLVNLPRKGEKHGLFEVRDLHLTTTREHGHKVYRAEYALQYFGATPLTVPFEPLEILYALPGDRQQDATYHYKSLRTQPVTISMARIGPYHSTAAMDIKEPLDDARLHLIVPSAIIGLILLGLAIGGWGWRWLRRQRQHADLQASAATPAATALALLQQEGRALHPIVESSMPGAERLRDIIRHYLDATLGTSTRALTNAELAARLHAQPLGKEVLDVLERCDTLKYQAPADSRQEVRDLWWEAITVFAKLHEARPV